VSRFGQGIYPFVSLAENDFVALEMRWADLRDTYEPHVERAASFEIERQQQSSCCVSMKPFGADPNPRVSFLLPSKDLFALLGRENRLVCLVSRPSSLARCVQTYICSTKS